MRRRWKRWRSYEGRNAHLHLDFPDRIALARCEWNVENQMQLDDQLFPLKDKQTIHRFAISAMNRRMLLRGLGALSATAFAGSRLSWVAAQDDSTPDAQAPKVGLQPDGTTLWRVQVAGASMDDGI